MKQGQQDDDGFLLVPGKDHRQRQIVDSAFEGAGKGHGDLDGTVGVIALADIEETRNAADIAEVELVETIFAAGEGEDDAILRHLFGELGVVVAAALGAVATADEEEVLDLSGLHRIDNLTGDAEDSVVAEADEDLFAGIVAEAGERLGFGDDGREVPAFDVGDIGPLNQSPGEEAVFVGVTGALDAVGIKDDRAGEVGELFGLILPGAAKVAGEVGVFFEAGVAVCREHLAVGVDIDPFAFVSA